LFRLYKSLGDYDVIEGIMNESRSSESTSEGLKLEASGSFAEAKKVYERVSSTPITITFLSMLLCLKTKGKF